MTFMTFFDFFDFYDFYDFFESGMGMLQEPPQALSFCPGCGVEGG